MNANLKPDLVLTPVSDTELVITRVFDAPRRLVYRAYTDPLLVPKWWGPRGHVTRVDVMDVKVGGVWRYVSRDAEGNEFAFRGNYREIIPEEKLVITFEFEPMAGHISVQTTAFAEKNGRTTVTVTVVFQNREDRDGMVNSGMERGMAETFDRLEEFLQILA